MSTSDENEGDQQIIDKKKFNEERIRAWKAQRLAEAEKASKERKEQANQERQQRVEQFKIQRQEELHTIEKEKKAAILDKIPDFNKISNLKHGIVYEHQQKKRHLIKKVLSILFIAFISSLLYLSLTTPFYDAEAVVTIKSNTNVDNGINSSLIPTSVSPNIMQNIFSAREYIFSREMMNRMEQEQGFISYFKSKNIHFLSRPFSNWIIPYDDYHYYKQRVKVAVDIQEGILRVKVQAINQKDAKRFADALLSYAESWVNSLSDRMYADKIKDSQDTLAIKVKALQNAKKRIVNFQISKRDLNPRETVAALYANINDIKTKIKETEREIAIYSEAKVNQSPVVDRLKNHLIVLHQQQKQLNRRLIDNGSRSMNKILSSFESVLVEKELAEKEWEIALKAVESIKTEVFNQRQYFLTIVPPTTTPLPVEPKFLKLFILISITLYAVITLTQLVKTNFRISTKT